MTDEKARSDRHPSDEPDGTTAYAASLSPVGETVRAPDPGDDGAPRDTGEDFEDAEAPTPAPADAFDDAVSPGESRAGYDVAQVSGDTEAVRPQ